MRQGALLVVVALGLGCLAGPGMAQSTGTSAQSSPSAGQVSATTSAHATTSPSAAEAPAVQVPKKATAVVEPQPAAGATADAADSTGSTGTVEPQAETAVKPQKAAKTAKTMPAAGAAEPLVDKIEQVTTPVEESEPAAPAAAADAAEAPDSSAVETIRGKKKPAGQKTAAIAGVTEGEPLPAKGCTTRGFLVNDYGKDGPTRDAEALLQKDIVSWTAANGIKKYKVKPRPTDCVKFLDFGFFDEWTCTASAEVCW